MQRHSKFALVGFSFLAASQAHASGFALNEQGVSGLGNAYAGMAALAEDATTVWWNPAGMSRLAPGKHIAFAGALIAPSTEFHNGASQNFNLCPADICQRERACAERFFRDGPGASLELRRRRKRALWPLYKIRLDLARPVPRGGIKGRDSKH